MASNAVDLTFLEQWIQDKPCRAAWTLNEWKHFILAGLEEQPDGCYTKLSKKLSWLLRHGATKLNLPMNKNGAVYVKDLLCLRQFRCFTEDDFEIVMLTSSKDRFGFTRNEQTDKLMMYCRSGHSDSLHGINPFSVHGMVPLAAGDVPTVAVHGTIEKHVPSIREEGLKVQDRPIHLATTSAMSRVKGDVHLYVAARQAAEFDNIIFYMAENGVLLTDGLNGILPSKYIMEGILSNGTLLFKRMIPAPEVIEKPRSIVVKRWRKRKATQEQPPINDCNQPLAGSNLGGSLQPGIFFPSFDCSQPLAGSNPGESLQRKIIQFQVGEDSSDDEDASKITHVPGHLPMSQDVVDFAAISQHSWGGLARQPKMRCDRDLAIKVTKVLRHEAAKKFYLDKDGWVKFADLMMLKRFAKKDETAIWNEVNRDKDRFMVKVDNDGCRWLRAIYTTF